MKIINWIKKLFKPAVDMENGLKDFYKNAKYGIPASIQWLTQHKRMENITDKRKEYVSDDGKKWDEYYLDPKWRNIKFKNQSQEGIHQTIKTEPVAGVQLSKKTLKLLLKGKKLYLTVNGINFKFERLKGKNNIIGG